MISRVIDGQVSLTLKADWPSGNSFYSKIFLPVPGLIEVTIYLNGIWLCKLVHMMVTVKVWFLSLVVSTNQEWSYGMHMGPEIHVHVGALLCWENNSWDLDLIKMFVYNSNILNFFFRPQSIYMYKHSSDCASLH